jgi:eukaryotic-like serine/threonine-protein kinase
VILTGDGVKLIDFGISALAGSADTDENGQLLGTAAYVAPERLAGAPVAPAADVYSLGVLLYRLLAGDLPWQVDGRTALLEAHLFAEPAPLAPIPGAPPGLIELCDACLTKDPHLRPSAADLARSLFALAEETVPAALPALINPGTPGPRAAAAAEPTEVHALPAVGAPLRRRRSWTPAAVLAGLLAIAAVGLVAAWSRDGDHRAAAAPPPPCEATFTVSRDWGSGFGADLEVHDTGVPAAAAWRVSFAFPGNQRLTAKASAHEHPVTAPVVADATISAPGIGTAHDTATVSQSGTTVTAAGSDPRLPLRSGESITVPISAAYHGLNPIPTAFSLNGQSCRTEVAGALTSPVPGTTAGAPVRGGNGTGLPATGPGTLGTGTAIPSTAPSGGTGGAPGDPGAPGTGTGPSPTPEPTGTDGGGADPTPTGGSDPTTPPPTVTPTPTSTSTGSSGGSSGGGSGGGTGGGSDDGSGKGPGHPRQSPTPN